MTFAFIGISLFAITCIGVFGGLLDYCERKDSEKPSEGAREIILPGYGRTEN